MTIDPEIRRRRWEKAGALWIHSGLAADPHVELASGLHSDRYFNARVILTNPCWSDEAAEDLVQQMLDEGHKLHIIDRVVGPAYGAITFAHDVARAIGNSCDTECLSGFAEKGGPNKGDPMVLKSIAIHRDESVLRVEDVVTTGGSAKRCGAAVSSTGATLVPYIGALVNRSGLTEMNGFRVIALMDLEQVDWVPKDCPLCKQGSPLISNPKDPENWTRLTGQPKQD